MAAKDKQPRERPPQQTQMLQAAAVWQGPIPPAHEMARYEEVLPGAADRILGMAEQQADHRQSLENSVVASNIRSERRGQLFGMLSVITGFGFSGWMIARGQPASAAVVIIGQLSILAGLFVYGRHEQRRERERRFQQLSMFPPN